MRADPLAGIDTWIFDLDNTLYSPSCNLFTEIEARMAHFIMEALEIDEEAAHRLRRRFFHEHGTTLRGLMLEHDIEPTGFLDYVHAIDLSPVPPAPELALALAGLPGKKLVFTNATRKHAERVLEHLGVAEHFIDIHDIADCRFRPKPDAAGYDLLLARHAIAPERAIMFEDMARNLAPAAALGIRTAWVPGPADRGTPAPDIDYVIDDLATWLAAALSRLRERGELPRSGGR
ncbi:MAG TPA: pyrimidine 5'-nucleotidase [Stellaceae bacterium]|nr:pyrimidine 5'-nucleotidase [Stellaceae bacterium]